jgi:hypothetical protein
MIGINSSFKGWVIESELLYNTEAVPAWVCLSRIAVSNIVVPKECNSYFPIKSEQSLKIMT